MEAAKGMLPSSPPMATMNTAFLALPRRLRFRQTKPENTEADLAVIDNVHLASICPTAFCSRSLMAQGKTRAKTTTQSWFQPVASSQRNRRSQRAPGPCWIHDASTANDRGMLPRTRFQGRSGPAQTRGKWGMPLRHRHGATVVMSMKIGFMGGSFDPVHFGHLLAAQDVLEQLGLDRLILVPAAQAPLKSNEAQATKEDRLAMLRLAIEGDSRLEVSDYELTKGGVSYTIDTVRHFKALYPQDRLFWVVGADQRALLPKWKDIGELAKLIEFMVIERPGYPVGASVEVPGMNLERCKGHLIEISSSELRQRVRMGLPLRYYCPQKVIAYIEEKMLYR